MSSPSTGALSHAGSERGERVVELAPRHGLRSPPVAQAARRFAREVERVGDAGETPRGRGVTDCATPGRHWRARSDGRPDCRCRPRRRSADRAAADRACRTSCRNGRGSARGRSWWRASPPAARSPRWFRASRSRGRSPPTADRGRDWSARSGGPAPAPGLPGNCPAAACGRPPSRRSRRTARCAARSAARRERRRPIPTAGRRRGEAGWSSARLRARRSRARERHRQGPRPMSRKASSDDHAPERR